MRTWTKASDCSDTTCVEVMRVGENVFVRDSKNPDQRALRFTELEWLTFTRAVRRGEFE